MPKKLTAYFHIPEYKKLKLSVLSESQSSQSGSVMDLMPGYAQSFFIWQSRRFFYHNIYRNTLTSCFLVLSELYALRLIPSNGNPQVFIALDIISFTISLEFENIKPRYFCIMQTFHYSSFHKSDVYHTAPNTLSRHSDKLSI